MKLLVTGGAGYIGSHTVRHLIEKGHEVVVFDNLSSGHRKAIDKHASFVQGDVNDLEQLITCMKSHSVEAVIHFAGSIEVAESVINPGKYFYNNVHGTLQLLKAMQVADVKKIVFSSTAAVYGNPTTTPILETTPCAPINPYGRSKWMSEMMIQDFHKSMGLSYIILRYFNVAGAWPDGSIGEDHKPETHLIPRILKSSSEGQESLQVFGTDYPTPDGTCIRDYVHVVDLAEAHLLAVEHLNEGTAETMNVGSESGFSVKEVIAATEKVLGKKLQVKLSNRRPGDTAVLVANSEKICRVLKWKKSYPTLEKIIEHAWMWHSKNPDGYED